MIIGPRLTARISTGYVRTIFFLVTRSWGWAIIGIGLLLGGLIWGLTSHQVSYIRGGQGQYQVFLSDDNGSLYFQQVGSSNYYVMHIPDYSPFADTATILSTMHANGRITFIASADRTQANVEMNGTLIFTAHPIERITFTDDNGQNAATYTNAEYSGNPNGYTINNWPYAVPLMLVGAAWASSMFFLILRVRRRQRLADEAKLAAIQARPSPFARELGQDVANATPYQGTDSFPK
jgi:hypothetical protein